MADQLSCTCGDVYGGFPRNGEEPTSNQYDSTCPIHGSYKELDRRKPSNQPSKESLERAQKVTNHGKHGKWRDCPCEACRLNKRLALEFDAVFGAAWQQAGHSSVCVPRKEFVALCQQNAALVSALRDCMEVVSIELGEDSQMYQEAKAALASYAPVEEICDDCGHAIKAHGKYGCEYERGDTYVTGNQPSAPTILMAQGPCGCKAPAEEKEKA